MKCKLYLFALLLSGIVFPLFVTSSVSAQSNTGECIKAQRGDWNISEKFVWENLCKEMEADLMSKKEKQVSFKFLKDILLNDDYSKLLPTRIRIKNAIFDDKIDLISESINKEINLTNSTFRNTVDLSYSTFSKSVNFDNSEFDQGLIFHDAVVKGSLSFEGVKFNPDELSSQNLLDQCRTLLNLQRIQIEGDLKIIKSVLSCRNPNLKEAIKSKAEEKEQDSNYLIDLKAAKIKVSVYLKGISLNTEEPVDTEEPIDVTKNENVFQLGVGLIAAEIGDAIIIDQTVIPSKSKQIFIIDMNQVKAKALIFWVDSNVEEKIKDYRFFKLFNGDNSQIKILPVRDYLSKLVINLEDANINTISILGNKNIVRNPSSNSNKTDTDNDSSKSDADKVCKFKLRGFIYNQLNVTAYKFLTICINSLYRDATKLTSELNEQENTNANSKLIQLLQPMERLSVVSKNLGVYAVEKEMMYRQKKLDYYLTKTNLNNSKSNLVEALSSIAKDLQKKDRNTLKDIDIAFVQFVQITMLSWNLVSNAFQDVLSGYGFYRLRIFQVILILLIVNFFLALFVSYQKQKKLAKYSLELRKNEIQDERLKEIVETNSSPLNFKEFSQEIDTIKQVIFDEFNSQENLFYLYLKYWTVRSSCMPYKQMTM